jgi:hypothetical protein
LALLIGEAADGAGLGLIRVVARRLRKNRHKPQSSMKTTHFFGFLGGAFTAVALTSCVYETRSEFPHVTETVETYHRPGYVVQTLPPQHRVEVIEGTRYYRTGDVYYRPHPSGYTVVESPTRTVTRYGTVVRTLPAGYRTVVHRGTRYYVHGSTYYRPQGSSYVIVESPF